MLNLAAYTYGLQFLRESAMAQRYKQSKEDRRDESRGMKKRLGEVPAQARRSEAAARGYSGMGYYQGPQERIEQELRDGQMVHEDHRAVANLPQEVVMRPWPKGGYYSAEHLDDTIRGIDHQMDDDGAQMYRHGHMGYDPEKY
jgi:hypothetical protein